ncbi:hypothetical protein Kpho02_02500 [Kitasatospora phosalacinea]|uniref:Uncharacterized protein n=1 Tax=Kitasatospora phosalacinea TaxID=2065 RepID=A0A9W6UXR8_9ACTN|nr:hypothetical protein [Kitasatospora phosalacinea]GLW67951.1 hypothetical protein Kpho02_02500 [Kitasatospora phosalacinea]
MSLLDELWAEGWMPYWEGLFHADGRARDADVEGPGLEVLRLGEPIDLESMLDEDPNGLSGAVVHAEAGLPDGRGRLVGGGGSHGSEGFVACFDTEGAMVWLLHLGESNEFVRITVDWPTATCTNNLDRSITLDLTSPDHSSDRPAPPTTGDPDPAHRARGRSRGGAGRRQGATTDGTWIAELWRDGRTPVHYGLFRADGTARRADCDGPQLTRFRLGEPLGPITLAAAADPAWTRSAEILAEAALPDGTGRLVAGGDTDASDGFFARTDAAGRLVWLVHLPCTELVGVTVEGPRAVFVNDRGGALTIDLTAPEFSDAPGN